MGIVLMILVVIVAVLSAVYIRMYKNKLSFYRENSAEPIHDFVGGATAVTNKKDISGAEYMTYNGLWDKSVKTYERCTFIETGSPYYDFFIYEAEKGGVVLLRRRK